ncbi:TolC family protein [Roseateles sp.]|uniref:TolC family protein n=1 Tax=Roseateles sp. TaxID=1971397 RepID=UPI0025F38E68|nr:TolC family protein [Roseateles sp.]
MLRRFFPLALAATAGLAAAQTDPVRFARYLDAVEQHSLDLAVQREAITSARAGVSIAGVAPDPSLSWDVGPKEFSREVNPKPRLGQSLSLSWTLETAGKRGRRVKAAESTVALTQANAEGVKHNLYSAAAGAFAEACRTREALLRQEATLQALSDVVRANEVRRKAGDVGGLELLQSRSERDQYQAAVVKARADVRVARINLAVPLSRNLAEVFGEQPLDCAYQAFEPGDDVTALVESALRGRDDVLIARATLANARDSADLARANRYVDPSVSLSYGYTPHGRSSVDAEGQPVDGSPRSNTLSLSVSIPIPLSRLQRGELVQAESAVTQALLALRQTELKAEADVRATHAQFLAARENLARYRDSVLADSQKVLEGMRLSYRNGAASLLELLNAQRSADDAYLAFLQAQSDLANATVLLQLSLAQRPNL